MIKKRIIAFDLEPQPMHSFSFRGPQRSKIISPDEPQERYFVDPSRPRRPVAHENIADYMQVAAPRKTTQRLQALKDNQPDHVKQNILKKQVEALLSGQRSHTLRQLRTKLVKIALALAENASNWHRPTAEQKRAESELSVSEIKNDALVYETVVSPTGYTYRRPRKDTDDEAIHTTVESSVVPAATSASVNTLSGANSTSTSIEDTAVLARSEAISDVPSQSTSDAANSSDAGDVDSASNEGNSALAASTDGGDSTLASRDSSRALAAGDSTSPSSQSAFSFSADDADDFDVPSTSDEYGVSAPDTEENFAYSAMVQSAVEASVRAYETTSTVSGTYNAVEHSFSSMSGAEASEAIAQSATDTDTTTTAVVAGEVSASISPSPARKRGRPRKIRPEAPAPTTSPSTTTAPATAATAIATDAVAASAADPVSAQNPETSSSTPNLASLAATPARKRGRPRKNRPEEAAPTTAGEAAPATTSATAATAIATDAIAASAAEPVSRQIPDASSTAPSLASLAATPARKRGRPRKIRHEEAAPTTASEAATATTPATSATSIATDAVAASAAEPVSGQIPEAGSSVPSLASLAAAPARKRGRPRKIRPEAASTTTASEAVLATAPASAAALAASATVADIAAKPVSDKLDLEESKTIASAPSLASLAAASARKRGRSRKIGSEQIGVKTALSSTALSAQDIAFTIANSPDNTVSPEPVKKHGRTRKIKIEATTADVSVDVSSTANAVYDGALLITSASAPVIHGSDSALVITKAEDTVSAMHNVDAAPTKAYKPTRLASATRKARTAKSTTPTKAKKKASAPTTQAATALHNQHKHNSYNEDVYLKDLEAVAALGRDRMSAPQSYMMRHKHHDDATTKLDSDLDLVAIAQKAVKAAKAKARTKVKTHKKSAEKLQIGKKNKPHSNLSPWQSVQIQFAKAAAASLGLPEPKNFEEAQKLLYQMAFKNKLFTMS